MFAYAAIGSDAQQGRHPHDHLPSGDVAPEQAAATAGTDCVQGCKLHSAMCSFYMVLLAHLVSADDWHVWPMCRQWLPMGCIVLPVGFVYCYYAI